VRVWTSGWGSRVIRSALTALSPAMMQCVGELYFLGGISLLLLSSCTHARYLITDYDILSSDILQRSLQHSIHGSCNLWLPHSSQASMVTENTITNLASLRKLQS
jgi:hypothetical protein